MRKKVLVGVFVSGFLFISKAEARTWIVENVADATCDFLPADGLTDPADAADQIRQDGNVPDITQNLDNNGNLESVTLSYKEAGGEDVGMQFFTTMDGCQQQLKSDIDDGTVTDPNSLK